ncbi:MAG: ATP-grasp domain-containing protein [Candidatus Nanopelagicaceae bacterium]|nr:ATP-grasp domain-containing protein [Candidatus Nanopelagicaceae bacterium]
MTGSFPVVGFVGSGPIARLMIAPAIDLGVDFLEFIPTSDLNDLRVFASKCDVILHNEGVLALSTIRTLEEEGFNFRPSSKVIALVNELNAKFEQTKVSGAYSRLSLLVARSPHDQCSVWSPSQLQGDSLFSVTPPPHLSLSESARAQEMALKIAHEIGIVGVIHVELALDREVLVVTRVDAHLNLAGNWTLDGSRTSQFEQHLRGVLDLPLGDPTMSSDFAVSATFLLGTSENMYRPYLHLMARSPALKFHQYRPAGERNAPQGHVTAVGDDLVDLRQCVTHAIDYMSGAVNE